MLQLSPMFGMWRTWLDLFDYRFIPSEKFRFYVMVVLTAAYGDRAAGAVPHSIWLRDTRLAEV
jgi:hypothetical protein